MAILKRLSVYTIISMLVISSIMGCTKIPKESLPEGFVYLSDTDPNIIENVRYATQENFLGRVVPGYSTDKIVCTKEAALALKAVHADLNKQGYTLVVYLNTPKDLCIDAEDVRRMTQSVIKASLGSECIL